MELRDGVGSEETSLANGSGAAAMLAAGVGSFVLGALDVAIDRSATVKSHMILYRPTGPLSGVTTLAIVVWLVVWGVLEWRWRGRSVAMGRVSTVAFVLLGLGLLLTFPPVADLF